MTKRTKDLLEHVHPNGKKISSIIYKILDREHNWIVWKKEGCKQFGKSTKEVVSKETASKDAISKETISKEKEKVAIGSKRKNEMTGVETKKYRMGNPELSRLWNLPLIEENLTSSDRMHTPTLQQYLKPLEEQMDPEAGIEEEYKLKNNKVYTWKALRLIVRHKLNYFSKIASGNLEDIFSLENEKKGQKNEELTIEEE